MSHEIRTPLNGVLGMAQVMAQEPLPAPQRERLEVLRQSGEVLLTLLNDLLDISRIEAAKLELDIGLLDFAGLGAQTQATFGPLLAGREVSLEISVSPDLGGLWRADANRVRQILFNLVGNAVKFTERGAISVVLRLAGDGAVVIEVADSGPGIPDDQLSRLFERFMLVDPSATRRHGGSGLGLAISRELARLMGGDISVDSVVGQGSTFTARLPLERASEAEAASLAAPEPEVQPELDAEAEAEDVHVLIAEDNKTNQLVLTTLLAQAGLSAKVVENGAEAVEAFRSGRWDVVLMDIQMPVMDGRDATRRIRELEASEGRPRTPIIAVTANAMSHQVEEYVAIGMDGLVPKPIQLEQLIGALCAALEPAANAVPA
jgi:CheY-like chemotaxis protein/anti-sigma regulatory factor (Ser/Thr protein kinase)